MSRNLKRKRATWWWTVTAACGLAIAPLASGAASAQDGPVAAVKAGKEAIEFEPIIEFERLALTVSGPSVRIGREFSARERIYLALADKEWGRLADGTYRYELRVTPVVDPKLREQLASIRAAEERGRSVDREKHELPATMPTQSGSFRIQKGAFVTAANPEPGREKEQTGDLEVAGDILARGKKSFVAVDPSQSGREFVYTALEGPEAGTYHRGASRTVGGEAVIELPDHFGSVTEAEGLTVQLTPTGSWSRLYIVTKSPQRLLVRSADGGEVDFDYLVQGVRKGYAGFEVERRVSAAGTDRHSEER